ncbi:unnamed protein product [Fraxinus pennsylvanica]|uniref:Subtilisin-like protease fibronectin type-III domain-containing protein n=1 Tax=Fraxinus pennsylvanica TaxID=56036 RepID=A0AAD2AC78_9LAMI|nr:unnamed protein product [Fraxinus pennsylvanica]
MIRLALMTTAYTQDLEGNPLLDETSYNLATIYDIGARSVNPEKTVDPRLVYDLTSNDHMNFLCAFIRRNLQLIARRPASYGNNQSKPWNLNYPAISVAFEASKPLDLAIVVNRTVTHVSDNASYSVSLTNPKGAIVTVTPSKMDFEMNGEKQCYMVKIKARKLAASPRYSVGKIIWSDGPTPNGFACVGCMAEMAFIGILYLLFLLYSFRKGKKKKSNEHSSLLQRVDMLIKATPFDPSFTTCKITCQKESFVEKLFIE